MAEVHIRLVCPICGLQERMPVSGPIKMWEGTYDRVSTWRSVTSAGTGHLIATGVASCPECKSPFGVLIRFGGDGTPTSLFSANSNDSIDRIVHNTIIKTVPRGRTVPQLDESLPPKIRDHFVVIQEDAARRRNAPGVMGGARALLDVALKHLGEDTGGRRNRINNLAAKGIITSGIAEWAQKLWEDGSDAVHDLDADMDTAIEHVDFLRLFFDVAFALPAKIAKAAAHDDAISSPLAEPSS